MPRKAYADLPLVAVTHVRHVSDIRYFGNPNPLAYIMTPTYFETEGMCGEHPRSARPEAGNRSCRCFEFPSERLITPRDETCCMECGKAS